MQRWILLAALAASACATPAPPRADVDAAVAALQDRSQDGAAPIASEILQIADGLVESSEPDGPHVVAILNVGADALLARVHAIRAARETVELQTFIWAPDDSGRFLFRELVRAAHRGVRVRLLIDQLGLPGSVRLARAATVHENLEIRLYNPIANKHASTAGELFYHALSDFGMVNHRMHNKVFVVDGRLGIVGGRNVADRYFDLDPEFDFLDRDALVLGPAAAEMVRSFDEYWEHELSVPAPYLADVGRELIRMAADGRQADLDLGEFPRLAWVDEGADQRAAADVLPRSPLLEATGVRFIADLPAKRDADGEVFDALRAEKQLSETVDDYLLIQANYLIFSKDTFRGLARLRERRPGVEITYSTNSLASTGCFYCYAISRKQRMTMVHLYGLRVHELRPVPADVRHFCARYGELLAEDERLGEEHDPYDDVLIEAPGYGPQFAIHSKSMVIDGRVALIGSHNFDPRSELHNTEAAVVLYGAEPAAALERELRRFLDDGNSWTVAPKKRISVWREFTAIVGSISRALPIFDIWPFRYTSAFELKEDAEPVPIDDPRFYENYRDVGEMPGTSFGWKRIQTRLFSAFGGATTSIM